MADVVIVVGTRRGRENVPVAEIRQMCGRVGRRHGGAACEAYVLVDEADYDEIFKGIAEDAKFDVSSAMVSCDDLVFHILPGVCSGEIENLDSAVRWYARSFGARQGYKPNFDRVFERLVECEAVKHTPLGYTPTQMAQIALELYFHPADTKAWRDNFRGLFDMGLENDDAAIAWALGSVPFMDAPGDFGKYRFVMELFKEALPDELSMEPGMVAKSALWWSALGGHSVGRMRNRVIELKADFGRVYRALLRLDELEGWGRAKFLSSLAKRVRMGIPSRLAALCEIGGMTKSRAEFLYNAGARDRNGIKEVLPSLEGEIDDGFMKMIQEVANGVC